MSTLVLGSLSVHAIISVEKTVCSAAWMMFAQIVQSKRYLIILLTHAFPKFAQNIHISQLTQSASLVQVGACTATPRIAFSAQIKCSISQDKYASLALLKTAPNVTLVGVTNIFG